MREQTLSENFALDLMREGKLLMRMHTVGGMRWFVVPGGQVAESVVKRILARPDVQPHDNGLFPGCEQTFRLGSQIRRSSTCQSERDDPSARRSSNGEMKMSIGKRKVSGDITPLVKFDARAGVLYRCDRTRAPDGEWYTDQKNITDNFAAVFDMENAEIGWIALSSGGPPSFVMVPVGSDIGNPPSDGHKQGFRLRLKLAKGCGGGVREFASTAASTWQAIDQLHTEFEQERGKHPGELPLVKLSGVRPSKTPMGTSYVPMFKIAGWMVRPPELTTAAPPPESAVDSARDPEIPF